MGFFSSLLGGSLPPNISSQTANQAISGLSNTGTQATNYMNAYGQSGQQNIAGGAGAINSGLQNLTPTANWFQTIMGGNKQATLNQLQPQIQQDQQGLNTGLQTASTLSPRGGGRSSTLFDLPFAAQQQVAQQYGSARAAAPAGLQSAATAQGALGSSLGQLGTSTAGVGAQYGSLANTANNNILNYGVQNGIARNQNASATGSGFGQLAGGIASLFGL
jgi:hypothetical protein